MLFNTRPAEEGGGNEGSEGGEGNVPDPAEALKVANEDKVKLEEKLQAQTNAAAAEKRTQDDRIKALESQAAAPKEDSDRIATLEVKLARSQAVSQYGLSVEDANLLKGTPEEILADAGYWAQRLEENKPDPKKGDDEDKTNKEIIDDKVNKQNHQKVNDENGNPQPPPKPDPKKSNLSWMERYKLATPAERYKMDQQVQAGNVDPTK